jgi:U4/U6 small nuclear ribonucleoprotein PRP3
MALALTQKDLDELKPYVDKTVQRVVGSSEPAVVNAAISCLASGADRLQITNKLRTLHPALIEKAHKLTDLIFELVSEYAHTLEQHEQQKNAKKRHREVETAAPPPKTVKVDPPSQLDTTGGVVMSSQQIKDMMANAQRMIEERKRALGAIGSTPLPPPGVHVPTTLATTPMQIPHNMSIVIPPVVKQPQLGSGPRTAEFEGDKKKKLLELQAQIQSKIAAGVLGRKEDAVDGEAPSKPVPLLLDNEGRAIDVSGKQLLFPQHQPTLKANIRAQKKTDFKPMNDRAAEEEDFGGNKYFDERLAPMKPRGKRTLKFNEPGKYVALAHRERMQSQLARLQEEIADKARKTGISTAARLARLSGAVASSSGAEKAAEYIPQVEWWDSLLLEESPAESTDMTKDLITYDSPVKEGSITRLIEHPTQLRCPTEPHEPAYVPVFLTKTEMKKLRRQNRREAWKEKQEKIRLGLDPAPAPKVRISNLMRVLGVEAVQDPTKVEAHVRKEMAKRLKTHTDTNANRKLTPEQKKDKKLRKLQEDVSLGVHVAVYRIDDMTNQAKKFKVDTNAKQLTMTGCVILYRECNLVVVEGGPKQQKKYKQLMMSRIKWGEDNVKDKEDTPNKCVLVWEGTTKERAFSDLKFKVVPTEEQAREFLKKHGVENYWDLALSGSVLENITDI